MAATANLVPYVQNAWLHRNGQKIFPIRPLLATYSQLKEKFLLNNVMRFDNASRREGFFVALLQAQTHTLKVCYVSHDVHSLSAPLQFLLFFFQFLLLLLPPLSSPSSVHSIFWKILMLAHGVF